MNKFVGGLLAISGALGLLASTPAASHAQWIAASHDLNNAVSKYTMGGVQSPFIARVSGNAFNVTPRGVAVSPTHVYVAASLIGRLRCYTKTGALVNSCSLSVISGGRTIRPAEMAGLAFKDGFLYVSFAYAGIYSVYKFDTGALRSTTLDLRGVEFAKISTTTGKLGQIAFGPDGDLFVVHNASASSSRVLRYSSTGAYLGVVATGSDLRDVTINPLNGDAYIAAGSQGILKAAKSGASYSPAAAFLPAASGVKMTSVLFTSGGLYAGSTAGLSLIDVATKAFSNTPTAYGQIYDLAIVN
jgi:hypothetical protein